MHTVQLRMFDNSCEVCGYMWKLSQTAWLAVGVILQVKRFGFFVNVPQKNVSFDSYYPIIWNSALYISYRFDTVQYFKMKTGESKKKKKDLFFF